MWGPAAEHATRSPQRRFSARVCLSFVIAWAHTFEEAARMAPSEEFSHTLASSSNDHSHDMEVSYVALVATPAGSDRKSFNCGRPGHFARSCPKPRRQDGRGDNRPRDRSNRGRGASAPSRPMGNVRTQ